MTKAFNNTTLGNPLLHLAALIIKSLLLLSALFVFFLQTSKAELTSFEQVPSVLAPSHGNFEAQINEDETISFELSYAKYEQRSNPGARTFTLAPARRMAGSSYSSAVALNRPAQLRVR